MARVVPAVGDFISFFDHDPSTNRRCIYFTLNRKSCPMLCTRADNWRVRRLRERIISDNRLDLLMDYAQYSCCSKANHQNRIENDDVLVPLGDRWMAEIESANNNPAASATEPPDDDSTQPPPGSNAASGMPVSLQTIVAPDVDSSAVVDETPETPRRLSEQTENSTNSSSTQDSPSSQVTEVSEFGPHKPRSDSVSSQMRQPLDEKAGDFKTGSLYIFDRETSPGYLKIGWTANTVTNRLNRVVEDCGYTPHEIYRIEHVPFARRVETLTHHELRREWREELQCGRCPKRHMEWFEVSAARAKRVLRDWAEFFRNFDLYDADGLLLPRWKKITRAMDQRRLAITIDTLKDAHYGVIRLRGTGLTRSISDATSTRQQSDVATWSEPRPWTPDREPSITTGSPTRQSRRTRSRSEAALSPPRESNPRKRSLPSLDLPGGSPSTEDESFSKKLKGDSFSDTISPLASFSGDRPDAEIHTSNGIRSHGTSQPPPRFNLTIGPNAEPPYTAQGDPMEISDRFSDLHISQESKILESGTGTAKQERDPGQLIVGLSQNLRTALNIVEFLLGERSAGNADLAPVGPDQLVTLKEQCGQLRKECDELEQEYSCSS